MFNKIFILSFFICGAGFAVNAETENRPEPKPAYIMPLAKSSLLTDIIAINEHFLVAVGARGHILLSHDGTTWQQTATPLQSQLTSVFFISGQKGWAVGHDSAILNTTDAGQSWHIQQFKPDPSTDKPLFDIYFKNENEGIAIGAYGAFYRTTDGGQHWEEEFHIELVSEEDQEYLLELQETDPESYLIERSSVLPHFNRLYEEGGSLYIVGEAGFIAHSEDFGYSWNTFEPFYNGSLFDINKTPDNHLIVVGLRGHVFRSTDDGESWQQVSIAEQATLNSVFTDQQGRIFITGNAGTLLVSQDDGISFKNFSEADGKAITNGTVSNGQLILVTEIGIKHKAITKSE
ncbi:YCF48-related protein [Chromatiaceae bacterium AAb-1]|nr:YCF48-related protein [Chromatiaceae bacterium AAb-1]